MCWGQQGQYLDGSVQVGFLPAVVEQACNGDAVRQVVDEGDVVDEVVRFSNAEYNNSGGTLKKNTREGRTMMEICDRYRRQISEVPRQMGS